MKIFIFWLHLDGHAYLISRVSNLLMPGKEDFCEHNCLILVVMHVGLHAKGSTLLNIMHAVKVGWVGQTFALAKGNESEGRKSRIRRSKEERKAMVESFIKK